MLVAASHRPGADPGDEAVDSELGVAFHVVFLQVHPAKLEQRIDDGAVPVASLPVPAQVVGRAQQRELRPGHVADAVARADVPGQGEPGATEGLVLPVVQIQDVVVGAPAEPWPVEQVLGLQENALERVCGKSRES